MRPADAESGMRRPDAPEESGERTVQKSEERDARFFELSLAAISCGLALWGIAVWFFSK